MTISPVAMQKANQIGIRKAVNFTGNPVQAGADVVSEEAPKLLSKIANSKAVQAVLGFAKKAGGFIAKPFKFLGEKISAFFEKKLSGLSNSIQEGINDKFQG